MAELRRPTATGPGRLLVAVYAVFAVSASARAGVQIATQFEDAPLAYVLSAVAAAIYMVATVALAWSSVTAHRVAVVACSIELVGVVSVGILTTVVPADFPDDTVWSQFGRGYGFVPLVLPILGLWWLRRTTPVARTGHTGRA